MSHLKILFINQPNSDYGQSLLYHGLTRLGHYIIPWFNNPFHFQSLKDCSIQCGENSPCKLLSDNSKHGCTNHPAHLSIKKDESYGGVNILQHAGLVITNNGYGNEELLRTLIKNGRKICVLDLGDSTSSSIEAWTQVLGQKPEFYFRREYLQGQFGHPLSYSFYNEKAVFRGENELMYNVSFLTRPTSSERKTYSDALNSIPGSVIGAVPHSQYLDILSKSKFSVAVRGAGFDTLRRWEIPARGSVLCLERSPIVINNDFEDGLNCIKFSSPDELIGKINYYLNSSDKSVYNKLRKNCFDHFIKYHTTEARAKELLEKCNL